MSKLTALASLAVALVLGAFAPAQAATPTILISIDGFRADYLDRGKTPTLAGLAAQGVRGRGMAPSYPSLTFPNHYTLVTGLRPDHHGIVDNTMADPDRPGVTFTMGNRAVANDRYWWDEATPIWVTAEQAGVKTATMFWPGSEVDIQGVRPSNWRNFDQSVPPDARVDQLLAWLDHPKRPGFLTLYFDDVDTAGHHGGPDSPQLDEALVRVDAALARLVEGLKGRGIAANLVIVADHGMAPISPDRVVFLDDLVSAEAFRTQTLGPSAGVIPQPGHEAEVEKGLLASHPHLTCWRKGEMPPRLHFGTNRRIPPIVCLAQTGWMVETHAAVARRPVTAGGAHGFDPADPLMAALCVANGPAFRHGVVLPGFDNVDVYPLLVRLIGITPLANDGDIAPLLPALVP
jgi:predicted AlkP superfamily pyrophosphatase or phosphodiesterase